MRVVSGIQPSGRLHLGNYFGAVHQFLELQQQAEEALYFIADLHALTSVRDGALLRRNSFDLALDFLALGLDPNGAVLFRQSDVPEVATFAWVLSTVTPVSLLARGHSYKDKVARGLPADAGLFTYPVLMAADILLYGADAVPVGRDQEQHLEMTRDIATKLNSAFVAGYDPQDPSGAQSGAPGILKLPRPLVLEQSAVVPGIDGQKMSKSYGNTIELFAPAETVRKRIMSIKTDPTPVEAPKPEPAPLLALLELMCGRDEAAEHRRTWRGGGVGYAVYKRRLVERFEELFARPRALRAELERQPDRVEQLLATGAARARELAAPVWERVTKATGIAGRGDAEPGRRPGLR